jgi:two-component system sensor histidine kinase DesK
MDRPTKWGGLISSIWLLYLVPVLGVAWQLEPVSRRIAGVATVLVFGAIYVRTFYLVRNVRWFGVALEPRRRRTIMVAAVVLTLLGCWLCGEAGLAFTVYLTVLAFLLFPARSALGMGVATIAGVEISTRTVPGWTRQDTLIFSIFVSGLAVWGITQMIMRNVQLASARDEIAQLAVAQERTRFSRDLHDLLGHSLTVVAVKAELAGRLMEVDPAAARKEIADVEQLARTALADVRSAVAGYREGGLAGELASARAALDAAGVEAELPGAVDEVPGERRELFGWTVREGVTNIVRHSGARHCRIAVDRGGVTITDDGRGPNEAGTPASGLGLKGLSERAETAGAVLTVGRAPEGGFLLRVGW